MAPLGQGSNVGVQITTFSQSVGDDFFRVMGIPLRSGRTFVPADRGSTVERAVIGETLARRLFPHRNPIGERFELAGSKPTPLEVIGVVGDIKVNWLGESAQPTIYFDTARNVQQSSGEILHILCGQPCRAEPHVNLGSRQVCRLHRF